MNTCFHINSVTDRAKRLSDLLLTITGLMLTLPLFPLIALAIRLDSPGLVFFRQLRIGKTLPEYIKLFEIIKFRTMVIDAERQSGATWAKKQGPRITTTGGFMRKTRLDELPRLFNVLQGEMSIIGPRPERPAFINSLNRRFPSLRKEPVASIRVLPVWRRLIRVMTPA